MFGWSFHGVGKDVHPMEIREREVAQLARIEESVEIKRPADKVFAYTTDARTWTKWQSTFPEAEQTSQGPVGLGTTFKGKIHMMGLTMKWTAKATEYEASRKFGKNITCGAITNQQHNTYESVGGGTKLTIVYDMKVGGLMKLFAPMIVSSTRKALKNALVNLKGILESQT
jgi:carbon monoxide dehydrogenase subunit G